MEGQSPRTSCSEGRWCHNRLARGWRLGDDRAQGHDGQLDGAARLSEAEHVQVEVVARRLMIAVGGRRFRDAVRETERPWPGRARTAEHVIFRVDFQNARRQ